MLNFPAPLDGPVESGIDFAYCTRKARRAKTAQACTLSSQAVRSLPWMAMPYPQRVLIFPAELGGLVESGIDFAFMVRYSLYLYA